MICANISRIIYCPVMLLHYRAFFFRSPRLPFIHQERFEQMCRGRDAKRRQGDIYIFFYFSFLKIPYLKIRENFVLSCRHPFFGIYYIINQIFKHRTIFVQKRYDSYKNAQKCILYGVRRFCAKKYTISYAINYLINNT